MKIYHMDCGMCGCIVVCASDADSARTLMKSCYNYDERYPIEEIHLGYGILINNLGDS